MSEKVSQATCFGRMLVNFPRPEVASVEPMWAGSSMWPEVKKITPGQYLHIDTHWGPPCGQLVMISDQRSPLPPYKTDQVWMETMIT